MIRVEITIEQIEENSLSMEMRPVAVGKVYKRENDMLKKLDKHMSVFFDEVPKGLPEGAKTLCVKERQEGPRIVDFEESE